jgi:hypothetical protein
MPRAVDPALNGGGLPISHSPLNRMPTSVATDFDLLKFLEEVITALPHAIETLLFPAIEDMTGIDLSVLLPLLQLLELDFSSPTAFLISLVEAILAIPAAVNALIDQTTAGVTDIVQQIIDTLTGVVGSALPGLEAWRDALLGPSSPLNSYNLFNLIPTMLVGQVPISNIGEQTTNLLVNPLFENLESVDSTVWAWDGTQHHSATGGSAKVTADGTGAKDLLSNLIPVTPGQKVDLSAWVKYTGLTGSGTPLRLGVTQYWNGSATTLQPDVASQGLVPPTSDWRQLSGSYTVPDNVDSLRMRLTVATTATAGTVWWSDLFLGKTGLLPNILVAGQNIGETLADDLGGLAGDVAGNAAAILGKAAQGDLVGLMNVLGGSLSQIDDRMLSFLDDLSPLNGSNIQVGNILDDFLPGVRTTIENIFTGLLNLAAPPSNDPVTHTQAAGALSHVADTLAGLTSKVTELEAARTSGVTAFDDFERTSTTLGANWSVTYPSGSGGTVGCDGHNAFWQKAGSAGRVFVCRYIPLVTYGDFQINSITLNSAAENPISFLGDPAYNDVLGRVSADNLNYVRFRMGAGEAWLTGVVNGIEVVELAHVTYSTPDPGPGSALVIVCGRAGNARYFQGKHNGNGVLEGVETGVATMLGANYRYAGFGGRVRNYTLTQSAPGAVRKWTGGDQ